MDNNDIKSKQPPDSLTSILLVEDEPTSRLLLERQLSRAGYDVTTATNGVQALAMLRKQFFPLLITDWDMPEMDGVKLCKAIRDLPLEGYVYTILLTAREGRANLLEGLESGADDYLTKPPDDSELRARLSNGVRIHKLEQSLRLANQRIRLLSITDDLTNAFNRRSLFERLPQEIEKTQQSGSQLSLVLCDIDHFKQINDSFGHQCGDLVLKEFAEILASVSAAKNGSLFRYGGEEFLTLLPGVCLRDAIELADQCRIAISEHSFQHAEGRCRISASFGVAGLDSFERRDEVNLDSLIARADQNLYRSKQAGRNRVTGG